MTKIDPFIAVKDVNASAEWYRQVFGFKRLHGGDDLAIMVDENGGIVLCLHKWGEHDHPTMMNPDIPSENGLLLYIKTENMETIKNNVEKMGWPMEEETHVNPNSYKKEFSLRDPDGYFLTVTEYHEYEG